LGVIPLSEGRARVFGRPVSRGNDQVGYLPQRRQFDPDLRIRAADLVRLGLDGARWGLPMPTWLPVAGARAKAARVAQVLELVAPDVNPILPFLDRVVYVANGQVVAGRPEEVIRTDTLSRLYGTYVEVLKTSDGRIVVVGQQDPVSYHAHET